MVLSQRTLNVILIFYVLFGFLWGLGNAPLFDEDEGFFAEGTREMVLRNDYISTFVNQEQRFDKPPLTNWLQLVSAKVFGWTEFAMRLPSALAAVCWMYIIFFFTKKNLGERPAFFATVLAVSSLQLTIVGKAALADSLLNACLTGAMFCLYEWLSSTKRNFLFLSYIFMAIGFLSKGPIAILVPGATFVIYVIMQRRWYSMVMVLNPIGIFLFLIIAAPWYILEYLKTGQDFINGFFLSHNVNRFQTAFEGHYGGVFYFVPVLLLGLLPFSTVILKTFSRLRYLLKDKWFSFLLIWFVFVFVLFSLSGTKLHHYIIYGYTPLYVFGGWFMTKSDRLPIIWPSMVLLILLTTIPFVIGRFTDKIKDNYAVDIINGASEVFDMKFLYSMLFLIVILLVVFMNKKWPLEIRVVIVGLLTLVAVNIIWMPRLGALLQQPVKDAAILAKEKGFTKIVVLNHYSPSFYFYAGTYAEERKPKPGDIVFGRSASLKKFDIKESYYDHHGVQLVKISSK